jgi:hypothetical protein
VLDNHVLELASRLLVPDEGDNADAAHLLAHARPTLQAIFLRHVSDGGMGPVSRSEGGSLLSVAALVRLSEECGLVPQEVSKQQVLRIAREIKFWGDEHGAQDDLDYDEFVVWLGRIAMKVFEPRVGGGTPAPSERVQMLLDFLMSATEQGDTATASVRRPSRRRPGDTSGSSSVTPALPAQPDTESLAERFCELHELPGEAPRLLEIYASYSEQGKGLTRQAFMKLVSDCQLIDRHLPQKQVHVIFMTAANSKAEDATMGMQQLLDALCMIASRKFADASSRVAGTQFLMESYVLPYAGKVP